MMISRRGLGLSAVSAAAAVTLAACTGGDDGSEAAEDALTLVIKASGDQEGEAVREAAAAFTEATGVAVRVLSATDLDQELSQGLASGTSVDVFYLDPHQLASYADSGALHAYGDQLPHAEDLYPSLVSNATYRGEVYGAPRGFSTLALFINTSLWEAAGLAEADYPTTWADLEAASAALAAGGTAGLVLTPDYLTADAFMAQAGGGLAGSEGAEGTGRTTVTAGSEASVAGLAEMKNLVGSGGAVLSSALDEGSGGDVFAAGQAAMTVAGYDLVATLEAAYPDLAYTVVELPEGSAGRATAQQVGLYGVAKESARTQDALRLVEHLTSAETQRALAPAQGLLPSVRPAAEQLAGDSPAASAFLAGVDYAVHAPVGGGVAEILEGFGEQLGGLAEADPADILGPLQVNLEAATS